MTPASPELTADTLFDGRLTLFQEKKGYRFSIDSVLLADFSEVDGADSLLDLGCGCGIMPLVFALRHPGVSRVVGVELQASLARLAERNRHHNGFSRRVTIHHADMRHCTAPYEGGPFDVVVSNPPYTPLGRGRLNPRGQKAIARHELALTLPDLLEAVRINLSPKGAFHLVYPARRLDEVVTACARIHLHPARLRMVRSHAGDAPCRMLLTLRFAPVPMQTLPPLVVHENDGSFTAEVDKMFKK